MFTHLENSLKLSLMFLCSLTTLLVSPEDNEKLCGGNESAERKRNELWSCQPLAVVVHLNKITCFLPKALPNAPVREWIQAISVLLSEIPFVCYLSQSSSFLFYFAWAGLFGGEREGHLLKPWFSGVSLTYSACLNGAQTTLASWVSICMSESVRSHECPMAVA